MKFFVRATALLALVVVIGVLWSTPIQAQQNPTAGAAPCSTAGAAPCTPAGSSNAGMNLNVKLSNPLKVNTIQEAIKLFVNAIVRLAIPVIVIFFLWSGLMFIFARGNPEKLRTAKNMFFYTIIGTLLILGAWTITNALIGTVNSITR